MGLESFSLYNSNSQDENGKITQGILKGKYHCTVHLLFDWFGISCMTADNFCFYLQNRLIQTSQTGGQWYSDTSFPLQYSLDSISRDHKILCLNLEDRTVRQLIIQPKFRLLGIRSISHFSLILYYRTFCLLVIFSN